MSLRTDRDAVLFLLREGNRNSSLHSNSGTTGTGLEQVEQDEALPLDTTWNRTGTAQRKRPSFWSAHKVSCSCTWNSSKARERAATRTRLQTRRVLGSRTASDLIEAGVVDNMALMRHILYLSYYHRLACGHFNGIIQQAETIISAVYRPVLVLIMALYDNSWDDIRQNQPVLSRSIWGYL